MKMTTLYAVLLVGVATLAAAQGGQPEIDFSVMDNLCRNDPRYVDRCFILPHSYASSITLWELAVAHAAPHGGDPQLFMENIISLNGWEGATGDLVIPAGVAIRAA